MKRTLNGLTFHWQPKEYSHDEQQLKKECVKPNNLF